MTRSSRPPRAATALVWPIVALATLLAACDEDVDASRAEIVERLAPRVRAILESDVARHRAGVAKAAELLAPGFVVEDPSARESQLRSGLRAMRQPPRGVEELIASPMTFLAAVDADGTVIARDSEPDTMRGTDFRARYPVVARALDAGEAGVGLGEFPATEGTGPSSWSVLFAAPVKREGRVVGALVAGVPLWRVAQRLSTQLRLEHPSKSAESVLWVFVTKDDRIFPPQAGIELESALPDGEARREGLQASPGGFTGQVTSYGKTFGWGVFAAPELPGEGVGFAIVRSAS